MTIPIDKADPDDPDILGDICPICGEPVADDEEWTRVGNEIAHLFCVEKP
jgi:hypothetical protein